MNAGTSGEKRLFALRGAVCCRNDGADITNQVSILYDDLLRENGLEEGDIVSLTFSVTADLDEKNPAAALRQSGRALDAALFVTAEAPVKGGLPRTIRALLLCYLDALAVPRHVYRNGAEILRPDRGGPLTT
ncbi:chorismate mutase [Spirochaetia bacterium]|nr:chorismate mutase [Spirochaetia bacterium]